MFRGSILKDSSDTDNWIFGIRDKRYGKENPKALQIQNLNCKLKTFDSGVLYLCCLFESLKIFVCVLPAANIWYFQDCQIFTLVLYCKQTLFIRLLSNMFTTFCYFEWIKELNFFCMEIPLVIRHVLHLFCSWYISSSITGNFAFYQNISDQGNWFSNCLKGIARCFPCVLVFYKAKFPTTRYQFVMQ